MTCYHPLIRLEERSRYVTAKDGHKYHKATVVSPETGELDKLVDTQKYKIQQIPCGQCIGCRLDYSKEWANRGYLESLYWDNNYFITLTYDDDHININDYVEDEEGFTYTNDGEWGGTLIPKDLQLFIKRLRKYMKTHHDNDNIRYMACGEYGGQTARPHYHLIVFNLNLPTESFYNPRIINKNYYYQNSVIEKCWKYGFSNICPSNWNTIGYVARYITKKINGKESDQYYAEKGQVKEFFRVSLKPAIGEQYYRDHWQEIYERDEIIIVNRAGAVASKPPKYFDELFKKDHPEEYKILQRKRQRESKNGNVLKDSLTSMLRQERLEVEERSQDEKTQKLIRAYEAAQ